MEQKRGVVEYILAAVLLFMVLLNFLNIVSRFVLKISLGPSEELLTLLLVWVSFLGVVVGIKRKSHIGMSFVYDKLQGISKKAAAAVILFVSVAFYAVVGIYSIDMVVRELTQNMLTPALGMPLWMFGAAIPVGCALAVIQLIRSETKLFKKKVET